MEDPDPQLRLSLREMLFDGDIFRWTRLENLVASAASQDQLDLDTLLDQVLDFLFSPNGGMLRRQLVDAIADRLDALSWMTLQRIGRRLPRPLQPPLLLEASDSFDQSTYLDLEPIRQLIAVLQQLPGFSPDLVFSRLPRLIREPDARRMGVELAQGLAERGVVRLVKAAAGVSP